MDQFKNIIEYLSIIISALMFVRITNYQLNLLQQSHYHFSSFKKSIKYFYFGSWNNFLWPLILMIFFLDKYYIQIIYVIYLGILLYFKHQVKVTIKLKFTPRIQRLWFVILVVNILVGSALLYLIKLPELISALGILLLILPFLIFVSSLITFPIESLIAMYYHFKAKKKLSRYQTTIIGITGSYGKTSTKNILYSLLREDYQVLATEKSYNTMNGVSKNINNLLDKSHQLMIVEMGATRCKDITKLVKLTQPKYGIVTGVGPQHLESFKSLENIVSEKMKLIDSLPKAGIGLINGDDSLIQNYNIKSQCRIVKYGLDKKCDYWAHDIKKSKQGLEFKISYQEREVMVKTKLLGKHNILNILASFALAKELGVKESDLVYQVMLLEPVKNRLSIEVKDGFTIIDDAFNSNSIGFRNALEVLNYYPSPRIIITPGIVEAGEKEEEINYQLSKIIAKVCDFVILVKTKGSIHILKGLEEINYSNVIIVDSFQKGIKLMKERYQNGTVLIENDVSDIYKI